MKNQLATAAARLRWMLALIWGLLLLLYLAGRFGIGFGPVEVRSRGTGDSPALLLVADATMLLLTGALLQLGRMLGAIASGELFSVRVVANFRAFAAWLLVLAFLCIVAPAMVTLLAGPGSDDSLNFRLHLRDLLIVGIALILFLVARLLERARAIEDEMREIV